MFAYINTPLDEIAEHRNEFLFVPKKAKMLKKGVVVADEIVKISESVVPVRLFNVTNEAVTLYKNTFIGTLEKLNEENGYVEHVRYFGDSNCKELDTEDHVKPIITDIMNNLEVSDVIKNDALLIIREFKDIFSRTKSDIGFCDQITHEIDTGTTRPINMRCHRIPWNLEQKVDTRVNEMLENGVITESSSPWNSPIVVVAKKDGDIRLCIDYRKLNAVTKRPIYPMPDAQQLFNSLEGTKFYSSLDLSSGYYQVPMDEKDAEKTAFSTRKGHFHFMKMPFGLTGAPATFQTLMHKIFNEENWIKCIIYLDDILVFGKTGEQHNERLRLIFEKIRKAGIKLGPKKCKILRKEVTYLGHVISAEGVKTDPVKVEAIRNWPLPSTVGELKSFLGFCNYYRKFIKDYARLVEDLETLVKDSCEGSWYKLKNNKIAMTNENILRIDLLKKILCSSPVLVYPNRTDTFILDTDASHSCIGAVLSQYQNGDERVISYASRKLSSTEKFYCTTRKELLAVVTFVRQFKHYLYGKKFLLRTDHKSITWMLKAELNTSQYFNWKNELSLFDFEVVHRPGDKHVNADFLSRNPECEQCDVLHENPKRKRNVKLITGRCNCIFNDVDICAEQRKDNQLNELKEILSGERPIGDIRSKDISVLYSKRASLKVNDDIIYKKMKNEKLVPIMPMSQRKKFLNAAHVTLGHVGTSKLIQFLKEATYWPNISLDVKLLVEECEHCNRRKVTKTQKGDPLTITANFPFQKVALDITGPLPPTRDGYRYILGIIDVFSRYTVLVPLRHMDSNVVIESLMNRWISVFGPPFSFHSDRGTCFESKEFRNWLKSMGIEKTRSSPYYPQGNSIIERCFRTVKDRVYAFCNSERCGWNVSLSYVQLGINSTVASGTGYSPFEVIFGTKMFHRKLITDGVTEASVGEKISVTKQNINEINKAVLGFQSLPQDEPKKLDEYCVGEYVLIRNEGKKGLLQPNYIGPMKVVKRIGVKTYRMVDEKDNRIFDRHISKMKRVKKQRGISSTHGTCGSVISSLQQT